MVWIVVEKERRAEEGGERRSGACMVSNGQSMQVRHQQLQQAEEVHVEEGEKEEAVHNLGRKVCELLSQRPLCQLTPIVWRQPRRGGAGQDQEEGFKLTPKSNTLRRWWHEVGTRTWRCKSGVFVVVTIVLDVEVVVVVVV